jgi:hypothetical protein
LSEILEKAGGRKLAGVDGRSRSAREWVARHAWELAATGRTELPGGRVLEVEDVREWLAVCSFVFDRLEGKPKSSASLGSAALVVPEDHEGRPRLRFTLNIGDALEVEGLGEETGEENGEGPQASPDEE